MKIRIIAIITLILAGILVTVSFTTQDNKGEEEYQMYLAVARDNASRGIPYTSAVNYRAAFALRNEDESIYREYLEQLQLLEDGQYETALKDYVNLYPHSQQAYEDLCTYYYQVENYKKVIDVALSAREAQLATEKVKNYYLECAYKYRVIRSDLQEAQSYLGNVALVKQKDMYGYAEDSGYIYLLPVFEQAGFMMSDAAAAIVDGEWCMINKKGYVVAKPSKKVDFMSTLAGGRARVAIGGKYGFVTNNLKVPDTLPYDMASNYKNKVAAVCQNGKWALIGDDGSKITEFVFDDVLLDEFDTCINNGVIFVKSGEKYYMVNSLGEKICETGFDDARPFAGDYPAAVCVNGKWGFVDATGAMVIEPKYDDARSFNIGLGGVCVEGKWGFITTGEEFRIEPTFYDCKTFSSNGILAVQEEEGSMWEYIKLLVYER